MGNLNILQAFEELDRAVEMTEMSKVFALHTGALGIVPKHR